MAMLESAIIIKHELRPCYVDNSRQNNKALFHRWVDKEEIILKFNAYCNVEYVNRVITEFRKNNTVPNDVEIIKRKGTLGVVEYYDGTVEMVEPTRIRFIDNKTKEYAF